MVEFGLTSGNKIRDMSATQKKELKTLKDINIMNEDLEEYSRLGPTPFFHKKIKQELGIKWIKALESGNIILSNGLPITDAKSEKYFLDKLRVVPIIFWIKHVFNIKEEDIK